MKLQGNELQIQGLVASIDRDNIGYRPNYSNRILKVY